MEAPFRGAVPQPLPLAACEPKKQGLRVCIVGGGGTGAALAYDLAQRGFSVTLVEKGELTSGATGRHHGQLHCGARYAWKDRTIARECYEESLTLSRIAGACIEYSGGYFVALDEEEAARSEEFMAACADAGIPAETIAVSELLAREPRISARALAAVRVPDGSFDAYRLAMMFFAAARSLGARILPWREAVGFEVSGGRMAAVLTRDLASPSAREERIEADFVVAAAGAWTGKLGALAGLSIPVTPAPGAMLAVRGRLANHVLSRLRPPSDGDILVPQRGLSIIGSTQRLSDDPEWIRPSPEDAEFLKSAGEELIPGFSALPVHAVWAAARPLAGISITAGDVEGRSLSCDFSVIDHGLSDGIQGFASVVGGKATVLRAMGEKAADLVCAKLGVAAECRTRDFALPSWRRFFDGGRP
jgi:glycerol-3-phosphate dehydrogenase